MTAPALNVLFLEMHQLQHFGEAILNHLGAGRFRGSVWVANRRGKINSLALGTLENANLPTEGLRSKNWDEYAGPEAPVFDFIFTVSDDAGGETCPIWPGHPVTAHWGIAELRRRRAAKNIDCMLFELPFWSSRIALIYS